MESICGSLDTPEVIVWADIECSVKIFACADDVSGNNGVTVMFCDVLAERGGFIAGGVGGGHILFLSVVDFCLMSLIYTPFYCCTSYRIDFFKSSENNTVPFKTTTISKRSASLPGIQGDQGATAPASRK